MDPENPKPMDQLFSAPLTAHLIHLIHWDIYLHQATQNEAAAAVIVVVVAVVKKNLEVSCLDESR